MIMNARQLFHIAAISSSAIISIIIFLYFSVPYGFVIPLLTYLFYNDDQAALNKNTVQCLIGISLALLFSSIIVHYFINSFLGQSAFILLAIIIYATAKESLQKNFSFKLSFIIILVALEIMLDNPLNALNSASNMAFSFIIGILISYCIFSVTITSPLDKLLEAKKKSLFEIQNFLLKDIKNLNFTRDYYKTLNKVRNEIFIVEDKLKNRHWAWGVSKKRIDELEKYFLNKRELFSLIFNVIQFMQATTFTASEKEFVSKHIDLISNMLDDEFYQNDRFDINHLKKFKHNPKDTITLQHLKKIFNHIHDSIQHRNIAPPLILETIQNTEEKRQSNIHATKILLAIATIILLQEYFKWTGGRTAIISILICATNYTTLSIHTGKQRLQGVIAGAIAALIFLKLLSAFPMTLLMIMIILTIFIIVAYIGVMKRENYSPAVQFLMIILLTIIPTSHLDFSLVSGAHRLWAVTIGVLIYLFITLTFYYEHTIERFLRQNKAFQAHLKHLLCALASHQNNKSEMQAMLEELTILSDFAHHDSVKKEQKENIENLLKLNISMLTYYRILKLEHAGLNLQNAKLFDTFITNIEKAPPLKTNNIILDYYANRLAGEWAQNKKLTEILLKNKAV